MKAQGSLGKPMEAHEAVMFKVVGWIDRYKGLFKCDVSVFWAYLGRQQKTVFEQPPPLC